MTYALDLTQNHFTQQHGDITVFGTWYGEDRRQCLALTPTYRRKGFKPAIVLVDDAHLWSASVGSPFHVKLHAPRIAAALGFDATPALCARIANMIDDHLGDLLSMPPKPAEKYVAADAIVVNQDGKERHLEIIDHV